MGKHRDTLSLFDVAPPRWHGDWAPRPVTPVTAKPWLEAYHYIGTINSSSTSWGVFAPDMVAIVQVGMPGNAHGVAKLYGLEQWRGNAEVTRVAVHPDAPKNAASRAIACVCERIYSEEKREWLFSYADTGAGHHGGIYQALNAVYVGVSAGRDGWLLDGEPIHPRTVVGMFGTQAKEEAPKRAAAQGKVLEYAPGLITAKHTYILLIGPPAVRRSIREHLDEAGHARPYPKRNGVVGPPSSKSDDVMVASSDVAGVAELVDAPDSKPGGLTTREGSIPSLGITAPSTVPTPVDDPQGPSLAVGGVVSSTVLAQDRSPSDGGVPSSAPSSEDAVEVSSGETPDVQSGRAGSIPADRLRDDAGITEPTDRMPSTSAPVVLQDVLVAGTDMYLLFKYIRNRLDDDTGMMVDAAMVGWENATT